MVKYTFLRSDSLHPWEPGYLVEYLIATNGIFVRAKRPGLEAVVARLIFPFDVVKGLAVMEPFVYMTTSRVSWSKLAGVVIDAMKHRPKERLYYGHLKDDNWKFTVPQQVATYGSVRPADPFSPLADMAFIELHSHGEMPAFFSPKDDADETGFRIYTVIGNLKGRPEIITRVGIYGNFMNIPSDGVYGLGGTLRDVYVDPREPY